MKINELIKPAKIVLLNDSQIRSFRINTGKLLRNKDNLFVGDIVTDTTNQIFIVGYSFGTINFFSAKAPHIEQLRTDEYIRTHVRKVNESVPFINANIFKALSSDKLLTNNPLILMLQEEDD